MLSITRQLFTLNHTFKYINNRSTIISSKAYYCKKKKIILKILDNAPEDNKSDSTQDICKAKSSEEIETVAFANEQEILQTVIAEKEKDANIRSRLSKECDKLNKRITVKSSGLNLRLDHMEAKNWEDYSFDKTIDDLKKNLAPIVSAATSGTQGKSDPPPPVQPTGNRIVRQEPGKVLFCFIPEEWFHFFIPITGVTGFGTFLFTFGIFLISKEYYILEHYYYNGLGTICVCWAAVKYIGPLLSKYLDKEIDDYEKSWQSSRDQNKEVLDEQILQEKMMQYQAEGQLMLVAAKRENVHLQLEENFRLRQMMVYREVLKRLNYHVAVGQIHKKIAHKNLVQYVTREVKKAITPDMEKQLFNVSIEGLIAEIQKGDKK